MKRILMILAEGFEELEFVAPFDIFKRAGLEVVTASITTNRTVVSVRGLPVIADVILGDLQDSAFHLIFFPGGGPGTKNLRAHPECLRIAQLQVQAGLDVAAICAAPLLLGDAGLLRGKRATCFPTCREELAPLAGEILADSIVHDGLIHTSRGAGTAAEFAFALVAHLLNEKNAQEIRTQMQF